MAGDPKDVLAEHLSRAELASALGLTSDTLKRWAAEKTGPVGFMMGGEVYYSLSGVRAWLAGLEQKASEARAHHTRKSK
jgi:hypothetical protein